MGADHADSAGMFDVDAALVRLSGDRTFFHELARMFLDECPRWLDEMAMGLSRRSAPTVVRAAHTLRGAAYNFAAASLVTAARQLEETAKHGDVADADRAFHTLRREVNLLMHGLRLLVERPTASNNI
jgi:two-component system, sensor histidine kinase and response regulator